MGPPSCMRSVDDRNVGMRRMTVPISCLSLTNATLLLQNIPWHFAHHSPAFIVLSDSHYLTSCNTVIK